MIEHVAVDARALPRFNPNPRAPLWWGIIGLIAVESSVVAAFIASYFYLRVTAAQWPPAGVELPALGLPTLNLALLAASAGTMWVASRALNRGRNAAFVASVFASCALAASVLVLRWQQFGVIEFRWDSHAYGSIVWTMTGFHFVHVVSAVIGTAVVGVLGLLRFFNRERQIAVVVDTIYWYFVAVVWLPFYVVLYWVPRLA